MAEFFGRRGVLTVISDFYEDPQAIAEALGPLRFRGNDLIVFHVLDPAELEFAFPDASSFEDLESGEQLPIVPDGLREEYRALVQNHVEAIRKACAATRVDYTLLNTSQPLDFALFSYLNTRERLMRVR